MERVADLCIPFLVDSGRYPDVMRDTYGIKVRRKATTTFASVFGRSARITWATLLRGAWLQLEDQLGGDLGGSAAKKYDIEVWLPGQQRYREHTSCSYHRLSGPQDADAGAAVVGGDRVLHTLNGTATAVGRTLIAILENHQRADGRVALPDALHPYLPERLRELRPSA